MALTLTQEKGLIFRITHRDNVPWILDNGMHAGNGEKFDPNYRNIGNVDLIDKRSRRVVAVPPGGTLCDYVPFYFTPYSIMMYNIKTGYGVNHVHLAMFAGKQKAKHKHAETDNQGIEDPLPVGIGRRRAHRPHRWFLQQLLKNMSP